ncbi:MAG: metal ABC transporter permease [Chlamydiia bacterium]
MGFTLSDFFFHPVLQASTFATLLLSIFCSLIGCVLFGRRKALLAETLSHAAYIGVLLGLLFLGLDFLAGAFSSLFGVALLRFLEKRFRLSQDVALSVTLSVSLALGTFFASITQFYCPIAYKQSLIFLYGQAATMLNVHVWYFSLISFLAILVVVLRYRVVCWNSFDPLFFRAQKYRFQLFEVLLFILLSFAVVIGSRACGIMLVSGMMIAPAIFARAFTHSFGKMLGLASLMGAFCTLVGNFSSVWIPQTLEMELTIPTGPLILIALASITFVSLFFSPKEGFVIRIVRALRFSLKIQIENALKDLYKKRKIRTTMACLLSFLGMQKGGVLTKKGEQKAQNLIRLHRLWELYLSRELGVTGSRIHESAEEMEHILDHEMEERLTKYLNNPTHDPHNTEIPKRID